MARHTWNSTPPRLWPILRLAAERGWEIRIYRPAEACLKVCIRRAGNRAPIIDAGWEFRYDNAGRTDIHFGPLHPGRWLFDGATLRSHADSRPARCNLGDIPKLLLEADHA